MLIAARRGRVERGRQLDAGPSSRTAAGRCETGKSPPEHLWTSFPHERSTGRLRHLRAGRGSETGTDGALPAGGAASVGARARRDPTAHYTELGSVVADATVLSGSFDPWECSRPAELDRLRAALLAHDGPILGICAGMQLLAGAAGGEVAAAARPTGPAFAAVDVLDRLRPTRRSRQADLGLAAPHGRGPVAASGVPRARTQRRMCPVEALAADERPVVGHAVPSRGMERRSPGGPRRPRELPRSALREGAGDRGMTSPPRPARDPLRLERRRRRLDDHGRGGRCRRSRRRSPRRVAARSTLDPRVQHVPDPAFPGHFNVLRATVWPAGFTGVKVVGDYVRNYEQELPSELALDHSLRAPHRSADCDRRRHRDHRAPNRRHDGGGSSSSRAAGLEGARARRRPRHRILERDDARPSLRLRRDPRDEQTRAVPASVRSRLERALGQAGPCRRDRARGRRRCGHRGRGDATQRRRSRSCVPRGSSDAPCSCRTGR